MTLQVRSSEDIATFCLRDLTVPLFQISEQKQRGGSAISDTATFWFVV